MYIYLISIDGYLVLFIKLLILLGIEGTNWCPLPHVLFHSSCLENLRDNAIFHMAHFPGPFEYSVHLKVTAVQQ